MIQHTSGPGWLMGIVFIVVGILGFQFIAGPVSDVFNTSGKWLQTEGEITNAEVLAFRSQGQTMYRASLVYKYAVDGKAYHSDQIQPAISSTSFRYFPQRKVKLHPIGSKVPVFYNPDQPDEALLEPGMGMLKYLFYTIPFFFILIGFVVFWKRAIRPMVALLLVSKSKI